MKILYLPILLILLILSRPHNIEQSVDLGLCTGHFALPLLYGVLQRL